jgi:hypothetical protein
VVAVSFDCEFGMPSFEWFQRGYDFKPSSGIEPRLAPGRAKSVALELDAVM